MAWALVSGRMRIWLSGTQTLGREDFPDNPSLSRDHVEIVVKNDSVSIKDLESSNGTCINGHKISPNISTGVTDGDAIRIGNIEFALQFFEERLYNRRDVARTTVASVFLVLGAGFCFRPSVDYGLALLTWPLVAGVAIVACSTLGVGIFWSLIFRKQNWTTKFCVTYAALVLASSCGLAAGFVWSIESVFPITEWAQTAKMEYFCVDRFEYPFCESGYETCPTCAHKMVRWKQDIMLRNLNLDRAAFDQQVRTPAGH